LTRHPGWTSRLDPVRRSVSFALLAGLAFAVPLPPSVAASQDAPPGESRRAAVTADVGAPVAGEVTPAASAAGTTASVQADVNVRVDTRAAADAAGDAVARALAGFPMRGGLELSLGWLDHDASLVGAAVMVAGNAEIRFVPWFGLGARAQYAVSGGAAGQRALRTSLFSGGVHLRGWNDATRGLGWGLDLGVGYLLVAGDVAPSGVVLDLAFLRLGGFGDPSLDSSGTGSIVLRAQQGLGAASGFRALFLGVEGGFEVYKPRGSGADASASFRYVLGGEAHLGAGIGRADGRAGGAFSGGFGGYFGLPAGQVFEPRLRLDIVRRASGDDTVDPLYLVLAGVGARLRFDPWAPVYVEAHGGWAAGTAGYEGGFVDFGAGLRLAPCDPEDRVSWILGARGRVGFGDARGAAGAFAVLGVEWSGGPGFGVPPRCIDAPEPTPEPGPAGPTPELRPARPSRPSAGAAAGGAVGVSAGGTTSSRSPPPPPPRIPPARPPAEPRRPVVASDDGGREAASGAGGSIRIPFGIEVEPLVGWVDAGVPNDPFGGGIALGLDFDLSRAFSIYTRFTVVSSADVATDDDGDFVDDADTQGFTSVAGTLGARLTLWTDPDDRQGWRFELGGGWRGRGSRLDPAGPMLEATLLREIGTVSASGFAAGIGLGLRGHQGLIAASDYRALFLVLDGYLAFSQDVPEPFDVPGRFSYRFGFHGGGGYSLSREAARFRGGLPTWLFGLHFGVPLGPWLEVRARADYVTRSVVPRRMDAMGMAVSGPEEPLQALVPAGSMLLRLDRVAPIYVEAGVGYAAHFGAPAQHARDGGVLIVGAGTRLMFCGSDFGVDFGVEGRVGLGGNRADDAILVTTGFDFAGGPRVVGDGSFWCRTFRSNAERSRRQNEGGAVRAQGAGATVDAAGGVARPLGGGGAVDVRGGVNGGATGGVHVEVTPPAPPRPVEIEVLLGVSLFAGALDIRVDPRSLPLDRIRTAGRVEVRIVGPDHALAQAEAQVRAAVGTSGKDLAAVVRVPSTGTQVRAVFVLYP
jgi:hypothetical protein